VFAVGMVSGCMIFAADEQAGLRASAIEVNPLERVGLRASVDIDDAVTKTVVDGQPYNVDASMSPDVYSVYNGGVLNVGVGAVVESLHIIQSSLNMDSAMAGGKVEIFNGRASIRNSTIKSADSAGLAASFYVSGANLGSVVVISDSRVSGSGAGIISGPFSNVSMSNTTVVGQKGVNNNSEYGEGVRLAGGGVDITNGSVVEGDSRGLYIVDGLNRVPEDALLLNKAIIDGSEVYGVLGAAIEVNTNKVDTEIWVRNGSRLSSGNGNLLEVAGTGKSNFLVDNSRLTGNLVADETSTLNLTLQNNAQLTGDIINSDTLAINSGARWQMVGDGVVNNLSLNGGAVNFAPDEFHTLSLSELSGNGTFGMRVDLDNGVGDLLKVSGKSSGNFGLNITNTGVEAVSPELEPLKVVDTEGGDAQFHLLGGKVDLGAYSYLLEQQGDDWFIVGDGKTISPSTQSVLALFNVAPTIWMSELATLRSRMGEVRGSGEGGSWMRGYGNRFNASTDSGVNYRQQQQGFSLGADAPIAVSNGQLLVGVMGGYSKSDLDLSRGTSGTVNSYYVGAYTTWLSEEGYYLDGVLKFNRFRNKSSVAMSDATKAKGNYRNGGIGGSVEFGKHIKLADDYFLEPFAQMSSVVIQGSDYTLDNGLQAKNNRTQSVLGKVGTTAGRSIALKDGGLLQPYVRVAIAQEFSRSNDVKVNETRFSNDQFGSRAELGAGVAVSLSKRLQVHADFDYMKGKHVEQPWGANVGLRFAF